jgi:hypothetical protein
MRETVERFIAMARSLNVTGIHDATARTLTEHGVSTTWGWREDERIALALVGCRAQSLACSDGPHKAVTERSHGDTP